MRDYFGLREHIRAALMALPIASTALGGCGRVDSSGLVSTTAVPAELAKNCVLAADAKRAAQKKEGESGDCPNVIGPVLGLELWLPEGVLPGSIGMIDDDATDRVHVVTPPRCCYAWTEGTPPVEGRPLIDEGRARFAGVRARAWRSSGSCAVAIDVRGVARSMRAY